MTNDKFFVASEYDLTSHLQELFSEYVSLYTTLYNDGGKNADVKDERIEMAIKLESANFEMSQLVKQIKSLQSDTQSVENIATQTISASKRSSRVSLVGQD